MKYTKLGKSDLTVSRICMGFGDAGQGQHAWTMGENGAPLIDEAKVSIECEVDGNYELEHFDHFVCRILATYADETVLNDKGKIDYRVFRPVLFEFPTYEYFVTGEKVGDCGKMNP